MKIEEVKTRQLWAVSSIGRAILLHSIGSRIVTDTAHLRCILMAGGTSGGNRP